MQGKQLAKKGIFMNTDELNDDLREEYDLQQLRVRKVGHARNNVLNTNGIDVHIDPDVATLFPNAQAVNEALRFLIRISQQNSMLKTL